MRSRRTGRERGANATCGARVGTLKWSFAWVNTAACSKISPASAGKRCMCSPLPRGFSTKKNTDMGFLAELSSQLPLRALWALIKANKTKFLISDPGVLLYGILPRKRTEMAPNRGIRGLLVKVTSITTEFRSLCPSKDGARGPYPRKGVSC